MVLYYKQLFKIPTAQTFGVWYLGAGLFIDCCKNRDYIVRKPGSGPRRCSYPPTGFDKNVNQCDKQKIKTVSDVVSKRTTGFEDTTFITI